MIKKEHYDEDLKQLGITDEQEKTEIINSLYKLAIIFQNNYNKYVCSEL